MRKKFSPKKRKGEHNSDKYLNTFDQRNCDDMQLFLSKVWCFLFQFDYGKPSNRIKLPEIL